MQETIDELARCLDTANDLADANFKALWALPDYCKLEQKRIEMEAVYNVVKNCGHDADDYEKDLRDFMDAHPDYKALHEERVRIHAYVNDILEKITKLGYEWDAAVQDFVKKAA